MPKPSKTSPATRFSLDKREQILTDFMAGISEEDIIKEHSSKNVKLTLEDIQEIIKYQKTKSPDEMNTIRKYRQKQFIDRAWGIIKMAQIEIIFGLKKHKIPPSTAMSIISQMVDKLRLTEARIPPEDKGKNDEDLPEIDNDEIIKAQERIAIEDNGGNNESNIKTIENKVNINNESNNEHNSESNNNDP